MQQIHFQLSSKQLAGATGCSLALADTLLPFIFGTCKRFNINSEKRLAMFFAQIGHESANLSTTSENLNYSSEGLQRVFPKYFPTKTLADSYARQPTKIANRVYANRMGNGNESSGDGWKHRGRGYIQLTGYNNYKAFEDFIKEDILTNPDCVSRPLYAALSSGWFWHVNDLNRYCDLGDILACTKRINGGTHGLVDRTKRYQRALEALKGLDATRTFTDK